ncbi:MAG TPA: chloride channel protein [Myxococcales bacterium]|nr:chloride channel protein [Myxococcales bacterium]
MNSPLASLVETPSAELRRSPRFREVLLWTLVVGVVGGVVACAYYWLLEGSMWALWKALPLWVEKWAPAWLQRHHWLWVVTGIGGALVGVALRVMGTPGEVSAVVDNIHMEGGRIDVRQTPSMVVASLLSITFGGSAGPEAPLVQINGSLGSWLGDRLRLTPEIVRTLTFCGMGAALGAFFGAPLGGALFALEIPHRRGLEYYEAVVPATLSATLAWLVFRAITGLSFGRLYHVPTFEVTPRGVWVAALCGVFGALLAAMFVAIFRAIEHAAKPLERWHILLGAIGGICIGVIAGVYPETLFFGEHQGAELLENGIQLGALALLGIALAKMLAVGCTLHSGFRGGFIFPLFFIGAAGGLALSAMFPMIPAPLAALCTMAAVNVAVTKTPVSTTVILATLSGLGVVPLLIVASFISFLLTTRVALIRTQRSRTG